MLTKTNTDAGETWAAGFIGDSTETYDSQAEAEAALHNEWATKARDAHLLAFEVEILVDAVVDEEEMEDATEILRRRARELRNLTWDLGVNGPLTLTAPRAEGTSTDVIIDGERVVGLVERLEEFAANRAIAERKKSYERAMERRALSGIRERVASSFLSKVKAWVCEDHPAMMAALGGFAWASMTMQLVDLPGYAELNKAHEAGEPLPTAVAADFRARVGEFVCAVTAALKVATVPTPAAKRTRRERVRHVVKASRSVKVKAAKRSRTGKAA